MTGIFFEEGQLATEEVDGTPEGVFELDGYPLNPALDGDAHDVHQPGETMHRPLNFACENIVFEKPHGLQKVIKPRLTSVEGASRGKNDTKDGGAPWVHLGGIVEQPHDDLGRSHRTRVAPQGREDNTAKTGRRPNGGEIPHDVL